MGTGADTDFMTELDAVRHMQPHKASGVLLGALAALTILFFLWAGFSQIDEIARGQGQVVPSQDVQIVQSLEGGILAELMVSEGDLVKKGQILLRISDITFSSEERGTEAKLLSLKAKKARLEAEANGTAFSMPGEIVQKSPQIAANEESLYKSRQAEMKNQTDILDRKIEQAQAQLAEVGEELASLAKSKGLLQQELSITSEMVRKKATPKLEEIRLQRDLSDISGKISAGGQRKTGLESELEKTKNERQDQDDKFRSQALGELGQVETELAGLQESLKSIGDRVDRTELRAPVPGIVNKIALKTVGGVIEPAMRLVEIVPVGDDLKIVARVSPNDIGFLKVGQPVKVRITAYDSVRYGRLDGTVTRVGANSVSDREGNVSFEIEVRTTRNFLGTPEKPLPVTPGMVAQIDVVTGKRTILEYLLKPILRAQEWALRER